MNILVFNLFKDISNIFKQLSAKLTLGPKKLANPAHFCSFHGLIQSQLTFLMRRAFSFFNWIQRMQFNLRPQITHIYNAGDAGRMTVQPPPPKKKPPNLYVEIFISKYLLGNLLQMFKSGLIRPIDYFTSRKLFLNQAHKQTVLQELTARGANTSLLTGGPTKV